MKISNIKIQRFEGENTRLKGIVTITFENFIIIRDIKIIAAPDFVFVAMPAIKLSTGEFKDICHPITMEFQKYIEKNIIDVFNSGELEKTFEGDFAEPKVDIRIKQVSGNDMVVGECDVIFDDKFAVHNIKILKVRDREMTVAFPCRKTQAGSTVNICELIKNNEKYCNQIIDAYLKMVEGNSNAVSNNVEQGNDKKNNANIGSTDELKAYLFEAQGYPKFVFYFPKKLGEIEKPYPNVFEIKKDKIQKVRVMVSKCVSVNNFEADTKKWIEKNKIESKMEEVGYRKEMIKNIPLEVYELKYSEHPDWAHKIYKIGFVNGYRITISGWFVKEREEIINQAFEKIELKELCDDLADGEVSLGILGKYPLEDVVCDSDFDSDDEYFEFVKNILNLYNDNIELVNRKLLFKMYDALSACSFPIWKENEFKKIIDEDKLPENFQNMTDEEKSKLFYGFEIKEDNIKETLSDNVPFINIDKLKYDIVVRNVNINKNFKEISIEFDGICNFFYAMVTFKYDDNFKISDFHVS